MRRRRRLTSLPRHWIGWLRSGWDALRESYWFLPLWMALGAAALATALLELDQRVAASLATRVDWIQIASAEGSRAVLSAVTASMITVTGVVFSVTIVALTLASSQFGPRLLRNFLRDRANQLVLGTFVATFLYSLLVLRAVRNDQVPYVATAVAVALSITSLFVLIYFVHHATTSIQASNVIAAVARELRRQLDVLFPERLGEAPTAAPGGAERERVERNLRGGDVVDAATAGYVRLVEEAALLELAGAHETTIELLAGPGDFVPTGAPLARFAPAEALDEAARGALRGCFVLGEQRTALQDVHYLIGELTEMAVRALSPGVNDPRTAIACIHRLGDALAAAAERAMPSPYRYDAGGSLRVIAPATTFADLAASCLDPIRRYGARDADVAEALLTAIEWAAERCDDAGRRSTLAEHAREVHEAFAAADGHSKRDFARVEARLGRVMALLHGAGGPT